MNNIPIAEAQAQAGVVHGALYETKAGYRRYYLSSEFASTSFNVDRQAALDFPSGHNMTFLSVIPEARETAEPVHWRAVLAADQVPQQLNHSLHVVGFRTLKSAEAWAASEKDFKGWNYTIEPLYAAPVSQAEPVMANGLTEAETNATASVAGLSQAEPERTCREPWVCVNCFSDQGPCLGPKSQAEPSTSQAARESLDEQTRKD